MEPLSCINCCHNPLQLGPVGTAFGFCTRHRQTLLSPHLTTCGQLWRKDLQFMAAKREQSLHVRHFSPSRISVLADASRNAEDEELSEHDEESLAGDPVLEEVRDYGE